MENLVFDLKYWLFNSCYGYVIYTSVTFNML